MKKSLSNYVKDTTIEMKEFIRFFYSISSAIFRPGKPYINRKTGEITYNSPNK